MESHNIHRDDNCENLSRMASLKRLKVMSDEEQISLLFLEHKKVCSLEAHLIFFTLC